jgi:hypothetical protein
MKPHQKCMRKLHTCSYPIAVVLRGSPRAADCQTENSNAQGVGQTKKPCSWITWWRPLTKEGYLYLMVSSSTSFWATWLFASLARRLTKMMKYAKLSTLSFVLCSPQTQTVRNDRAILSSLQESILRVGVFRTNPTGAQIQHHETMENTILQTMCTDWVSLFG